jgi:transposase
MLHRVRSLLIRQRTMLVNALRAHMAEFGITAPPGLRNVVDLTKIISHEGERLSALARPILQIVVDQLNETNSRIGSSSASTQTLRPTSAGRDCLQSVLQAGVSAIRCDP